MHRMMRELGRIVKPLVLVCAMVGFTAGAALADKAEDWKELARLMDGYATFASQYSGTHDQTFVDEWKAWRGEFEPFIERFRDTYGTTREELEKAFEDVDVPEGVYVYPANLLDIVTLDLDAKQKEIASWIVKEGDEMMGKWEALENPAKEKLELRADYAARAVHSYGLANELSPGVAEEPLKKAEDALEESTRQWRAVLDELEWPGHNPDFEGPGDPDELAGEALALLRRMKEEGQEWSKPEYDDEHIPVAACVTGSGWEVYKTAPITQEPTQYSLQMLVLFKGTRDPEIGYAYTMHFYTAEEAGVDKAPPFKYCNSAQYAKYKMLLSKVDGAGSSSSMGFFGFLARLVLSLALLAGGIVAGGSLLKSIVPKASGFVDGLAMYRRVLALALPVVGVLAFLRTLILLAPLADILPQAAAVLLGLAMLASAPAPEVKDTVTEKVEELTEKLSPASKALAPFRTLLGQAAVALGLIHLLIGGVALF